MFFSYILLFLSQSPRYLDLGKNVLKIFTSFIYQNNLEYFLDKVLNFTKTRKAS